MTSFTAVIYKTIRYNGQTPSLGCRIYDNLKEGAKCIEHLESTSLEGLVEKCRGNPQLRARTVDHIETISCIDNIYQSGENFDFLERSEIPVKLEELLEFNRIYIEKTK